MENKNLRVRVPNRNLLNEIYDETIGQSFDSSLINDLNSNDLSRYMLNKFNISVASPNSTLFTSMLYDYLNYFSNKQEVEKLFITPLSKLSKIDYSNEILSYSIDIIKELNAIVPGNYNIIGGKIVDLLNGVSFNDSVGDFDIWLTGVEDYTVYEITDKIHEHMAKKYEIDEDKSHNGCCSYFDKKYNKNITIKIQVIIKSEFVNVNDIFSKFDFLHCCIGIDSKNIFWRQGALKAIKQKNIVINGLYPSRVLHERIIKYINRGYKINYPNFILCAISVLFGVFNSPEIPISYVKNANFDNPIWRSFRGGNSYESVTNDNF